MKWKKDDIRCEYRPFYVSKLFTFIFILYSLFFILYSQAHQLRSSSFYFIPESKISCSVRKHIIHTCSENIGYLIDFEE